MSNYLMDILGLTGAGIAISLKTSLHHVTISFYITQQNTKEMQNKLDNFVRDLKDMLSKREYYMLLTRFVDWIRLILNIFSIAYDSLGFTDNIKISIGINCSLMTQLICCFGNIIYMFLIYPVLKLKYQVAGKLYLKHGVILIIALWIMWLLRFIFICKWFGVIWIFILEISQYFGIILDVLELFISRFMRWQFRIEINRNVEFRIWY